MSWFRTARRAVPIALITALIAAPVCAANAPATPPDGAYAYAVMRAGQKVGDSTVTVKKVGVSITVHEVETFVGVTDTVDETLEPNDLLPTSYLSSFPLTSEVGIVAHLAFYSGGARETVDGTTGETDFQLETGTTRLLVVDGAMMAGFLFLPAQVKALSLSAFTVLSPSRADTYACKVDSASKPTRPDALPQTDISIAVNGSSPAGDVRFVEWYDPQSMVVDEVDVPAEQVTITRTRGTHKGAAATSKKGRMMETKAPTEKANGLATYLSVLTSPTAAFTQLARTPMWGWAAVIGIALAVVSVFISMPELLRVAAIAQAARLAEMPADQQAQARQAMAAAAGVTKAIIIVSWIIIPWVAWLISAVVYTIGAAISGATARFSLAWVASVNVSIVAWVGAVVNAVILAARGPDSISSPLDAQALPSLGMLVHGSPKLIAFLNAYNLDYIWLYIVAIIALERMLAMKRPAAVTTVLVYSLITAGLGAAFAK